ncbi:MAG: prepilin-type N-terminal cleavage/methylation domain-containing protein [Deltaproteobacteria bacterium]|nr:prepilin-type N-terminal cleavage/methylation domain-containing protein [Deltaproteobacteria bacterium]
MIDNKKGFTLIELVMVIVILAILAAVAIPRFIDLQSDARISTAKGIGASIAGAANILHSQYLLKGTTYMLGTTEAPNATTAVLFNANIAGVTVVVSQNATFGADAERSALVTITVNNNPYNMTYTNGNTTLGPQVKFNF